MRILRNLTFETIGWVTVTWSVVFAAVHFYWAAGGAFGMNGDPADTPGAQAYIGFIALLGVLGGPVALRLVRERAARRSGVSAAGAGERASLRCVLNGGW